jgi:hypothetical protein
VSFSGTFSGITSISSDSFSTFNIANALNIEANNISAVGSGVDVGINLVPQGAGTVNIGNLSASGNTVVSTNTNGNINLTPNGTGSVVVSKIDVQAGSVPFGVITNKAYGQFYSTQDQSTTANTPVAATFNTSDAFNTNITLASGSHIVFADPGVYRVTTSIQFANSNTSDHIATFWFRQNGADLANSASVTNIPKAADGGLTMVEITVLVSIAATNDYLELWWAPDHAAVTIDYSAAQTSPYTRPAIPSVILVAERAE